MMRIDADTHSYSVIGSSISMLSCSSILLFSLYLFVVVSGFNVNVTNALKSLYQHHVQDIQGNTVSLEQYHGKVGD